MTTTEGSPDSADQPHSDPPSCAAAGGVAATGPARRLLLTGLPIAVTLASRPALAQSGQCTASVVLSGNLSQALPVGTNCGLTPSSWTTLAGTNQLWPRAGFSPSSSFTSACGGGPPVNSAWTCSGSSLLSALQGNLTIQCKIKSTTVTLDCSQFGPQVAAALLNASCFAPTNYPVSMTAVCQLVQQIWSSTPTSQTAAQSQLDSVTNTIKVYNINQ